MKIKFECQNCNTPYSTDIENAGKSGKCKKCGYPIKVPQIQNNDDLQPMPQKPPQKSKYKKWLLKPFYYIILFLLILLLGTIAKEFGRYNAKKAVDNFRDAREEELKSDKTIISILQTLSNEVNSQCPITVDKYTALLSAVPFGKTMKYTYRIDWQSLKYDTPVSINEMKEAMKKQMINRFCTSPDLEVFRESNVIMDYQYFDIDGTYLFSFTIDKTTCN